MFDSMEKVYMCARERAIVSCTCWPCVIIVAAAAVAVCGYSNEDVENSSSENELWPLLDYC